MFLHASSVSFSWPQGGEFSVNTPLPPELGEILDELDAQKKPAQRRPRAARGRRSAARPRAR